MYMEIRARTAIALFCRCHTDLLRSAGMLKRLRVQPLKWMRTAEVVTTMAWVDVEALVISDETDMTDDSDEADHNYWPRL